MKKLMFVAFATLAGVSVQADTVNNVMKAGEDIFSESTWGIQEFSDQDDYVLSSGYLSTLTKDRAFLGKSFRVKSSGVTGFLPKYDSDDISTVTFPNDGIIFEQNSTLRYWGTASRNASVTIKGTKMKVEDGSSGKPLWIKTTKEAPYGCTYNLDLPLVGSSSAYIRLSYYSSSKYMGWSKLCLNADSPDFKGVIMLSGNNNELEFNVSNFGGGKVYLDPPCRVTMPSNCIAQAQWLQLGDVAGTTALAYRWNGDRDNPQYGYLNLYDGDYDDGRVTFPSAAHNVVFEVPTELAVYCATDVEGSESGERAVTLLTTKQAISPDNYGRFSLTMTGAAPYGADSTVTPTLRFTAIEGGGTRVQAVGTWRKLKYSYLKTGDSSAADNHGSSLLAVNATNWTDNTTMDPTVSYVVTKGLQLMTHSDARVFTGGRLILEGVQGSNRSRLALVVGTFEVTNLFCHGGSMIQAYSAETHLKGGPVHFLSPIAGKENLVRIMPPANSLSIKFMLDVPIVSSDGVGLNLLYQGGVNGRNCTEIHLKEPSPDHAGSSEVGLNASYDLSVSTPETKYLTVYFDDPLCFGGAAKEWMSNGLRVDGDQRIRPTKTMTFEANLNRGFISGDKGARLEIPEGVTLTFKQPMLWLGPLTKMGPGTFARGGTYLPRFKSSGSTDPSVYAGTSNYWFLVRGGSVMALSSNAYNGVSLRFSEGGGLMVDASTTDADMQKYGFVNTKIDDPLVCAENEKIPLRFTAGASTFDHLLAPSKTVAVCTVKGDAAAAPLLEKFSVVRPKGVSVKLTAKSAENVDGAYTVYAELAKKGMMLILK